MSLRYVGLVVALVVPLALTGCVAKSTHRVVEERLAQCEQEKATLQEQVTTWETRFDQQSQRWETMQTTVTEALPQALQEMNAERDRIVKLVPVQVQQEVEQYLDKYFDTVMKGFGRLQQDNEALRTELQATNQKLDSLGVDTSDIRSTASTIDTKLEEEREKRRSVAGHVADINQLLANFDQSKINCKDCPTRLKLNREERETITAFHQQLSNALSSLQAELQ